MDLKLGDLACTVNPPEDLTEHLDKVVKAFHELGDISETYLVTLAESDYSSCIYTAKDARALLLNLMDEDSVISDPGLFSQIQDSFDMLSAYIRDHLQMQYEEEAAYAKAVASYDEVGEAVGISDGERRKFATVVRRKFDGTSEYKFPIPDKAHARVALARIDQSDLSDEEKAKVKKRARRVLGKDTVKESSVETPASTNHLGINLQLKPDTIDVVSESTEFITISESSYSLQNGELVATILAPGFNVDKGRYYTKEAIQESVSSGKFNGLKMYFNHGSIQEMRAIQGRNLNDWVSTIKESWIDPSTGAAMGRCKVVRKWFKDFLNDLKESDAVSDVGISIYAQARGQNKTMDGHPTQVIESFPKIGSVDWVTEPGAGGRVTEIWESYQPLIIKEQELNVLNSQTVEEAVKTIRESRPDVLEALATELRNDSEQEQRVAEAAGTIQDLAKQIEDLTKAAADKDAELAASKAEQVKASQITLVTESLSQAELPQKAKDRIKDRILLTVHESTDALQTLLDAEVKAEIEYLDEVVKESTGAARGTGIKGLGSTKETLDNTATASKAAEDRMAKLFGHTEVAS